MKKEKKKKWGGVSALGVKGDNHKQIRKAEQNFNFVTLILFMIIFILCTSTEKNSQPYTAMTSPYDS